MLVAATSNLVANQSACRFFDRHFAMLILFFALCGPISASTHISNELIYAELNDSTIQFKLTVRNVCTDFGNTYFPVGFYFYRIFLDGEIYETDKAFRISKESIIGEVNCFDNNSTECQQESIYVWETIFPQGHQLSLKEIALDLGCCRRNAINTFQGLSRQTAYLRIEGSGLNGGGSQFNSPIPLIICRDNYFSFDFGVSDPEGDQRVYSFFAPFSHIPQDTLAQQPLCTQNNIAICPPPYVSLVYTAPYTILNPLGTNSSLNSQTGLLQGEVNTLGDFNVGIKVEEYRNGILLSTTYRDVAFRVVPCTRIFTAVLPAPLQSDTYQYQSCADTTFTFLNESTNVENIDSAVWQFSHGYTTSEWEPTVTFPGPGSYTGMLVLNPGQECADTARLAVTIHPDPQADFDYSYDPCVAGPVAFYDRSTGGTPPYAYAWNFASTPLSGTPNGTDTLPDPVAQYATPGPFDVALAVTDANECADTLVRVVDYRPAPAVLVVAPADTLGCPPVSIRFDNLSVPVDTTYTVRWNFGDGNTSDRIDPAHTYTEVGVYDVSLSIESPLGCMIDTVFRELIRIQAPPSAAFAIEPERPTSLQPEVGLTADDPTLPRYDWQVDGATVGENAVAGYTFPDTGSYVVALVVTDRAYCQDTVARTVRVAPAATYHLPNAFTPNADGRNETFRGTGETRYLSDFSLQIFDRHGGRVFATTDPGRGWDGRLQGQLLPQGVYTWRLAYTDAGGEAIRETGSVVLLR